MQDDFPITVTVEADEPFATTFAAFLADNEGMDEELVPFVPALLAGVPVHLGGGAAPEFTVRLAA